MRAAAEVLSRTLGWLSKHIAVGQTGCQLDALAEDYIRQQGAEPAFLGLYGFPYTLCISVNDAIVHGLPSDVPFASGDMVSIDCGVKKEGWYADQAYTFGIGTLDPTHAHLLHITHRCLELGIAACRIGARLGDIGFAIQSEAERHGYGVVTELVGHGIGQDMHEGPDVPNTGRRGHGPLLKEGMVLAIEPMINLGSRQVRQDADGWTLRTADQSMSAHYEHTVALIGGQTHILTNTQSIQAQYQVPPLE